MFDSLLIKVAGLQACNFIKKSFRINIAKFLRIPTLKNICELLLLFLKCFTKSIDNLLCKTCNGKVSMFQWFKGYLRYKTITHQNVLSGAQVKNFFIS